MLKKYNILYNNFVLNITPNIPNYVLEKQSNINKFIIKLDEKNELSEKKSDIIYFDKEYDCDEKIFIDKLLNDDTTDEIDKDYSEELFLNKIKLNQDKLLKEQKKTNFKNPTISELLENNKQLLENQKNINKKYVKDKPKPKKI